MLSENVIGFVRRVLAPIDFPLLAILGALLAYAFVVQLSASNDAPARINSHILNLSVALAVMWVVANVPPSRLMNLAVPLYVLGVAAADRHRVVRRHLERRAALAQSRASCGCNRRRS